jgi:hypothetical protein
MKYILCCMVNDGIIVIRHDNGDKIITMMIFIVLKLKDYDG